MGLAGELEFPVEPTLAFRISVLKHAGLFATFNASVVTLIIKTSHLFRGV
jgi:hypothetical protein